MNLRNYTSSTPASNSIEKIERALVRMKAQNINKHYENQQLKGITFLIDVKGNTVAFELPANVEAVFRVLWSEMKKPTEATKTRLTKQAEMTAWKIIADWVDIQASMIYLEQAEVMQVFLPYAKLPNGTTVYNHMKSQGLKMLTDGK